MSQLGNQKISPHHNVVKDENGSFIPPTQRPDGTWRKAIRVKEGYVPQDEVPLYESKGKQWASRNSQYPFGFSPVSSNQDTSKPYIPGLVIVEDSSKKSKSKKKSSSGCEQSPGETEKKKEQSKEKPKSSSAGGNANTTPSAKTKSNKNSKDKAGSNKKDETAPTEVSPEAAVDLKKKLRNTKKKLKEIEAIEEKIKVSGSKSVDADQRKKVTTKAQVLRDILELQQLSLNS